ncbi:MAG: glutamate-5-semialdehyde dehydrogenase [Alphaproteobacteria bacterium]
MSLAEIRDDDGIEAQMRDLGRAAKAAVPVLAQSPAAQRDLALTKAAEALRRETAALLEANAADMKAAAENGVAAPLMDRLLLDEARIEGIAQALEGIAAQPDPIGAVVDEWKRPNGLDIARVKVPLGVVGIIYESRPNVTADAGGLCLKAGNAAILRGGSESFHSSRAIHACLVEGLREAGLPEAAVQLVPTRDRAAVGAMLRMVGLIDIIVPRGGKGLIERVQNESRLPVIAHLDGNCHVYVDGAADATMALAIVVNAKMRRTSICGAAETVLFDSARPEAVAPIVKALLDAGCEVRGDETVRQADDRVVAAGPADWDTEYLAPIIAARMVDGVEDAIQHIETHGSHHTDAIVTEDATAAKTFFRKVDSAILLHNASTQFADGGEFGMGAEIGISTGRLHARGPVGAQELTTIKYIVRGSGQTRP